MRWTGVVRTISLSLVLVGGVVSGAPVSAQKVPSSREQITQSFAPVAKAAMPSVVNIYAQRIERVQSNIPLYDDPFFRHFFGENHAGAIPRERVERSLGSGVVIDGKGMIVTNHHVVEGADQITVILSDRREYAATLIGSDKRTDLAVLRVDVGSEPLPALPLGDSDSIEVGDLVLAIGNPFGVGQTVTNGIVSALARSNVGVGDFRSFIQTDAAINPGNSGGALVAMDGRLIGINTAIYSRSGGSVGIGFAIPTNLVRVVIDSLVKDGKVVRPWLGVIGEGVTHEMAKALKLERPIGVLISTLVPNGPAARAGLKVGDLIVTVNGHTVEDAEAMRFRLALLPLGSKGELGVARDGVIEKVSVELLAPPEDPPRDQTELTGSTPFAGAVVANMNPALADELEADITSRGVIVVEVLANSPAARLGIRSGDLIRMINGIDIAAVADLKKADSRSRRWIIGIERDGKMISATVIR